MLHKSISKCVKFLGVIGIYSIKDQINLSLSKDDILK